MRQRQRQRQRHRPSIFVVATLLFLGSWFATSQAQQKTPPPASGGAASAAPRTAALKTVHRELLAYDTAGARAKMAAVLDPNDPSHLVLLGRVLEQERDYPKAVEKLRQGADLAPHDPEPWIYLGEVYLHWDKGDEAKRAFARARDLAQRGVEQNREDARTHLVLGVAHQRLKAFDEAMRSLGRARELAGDDAEIGEILYQIGATRAFQERFQEAVESFSRALEKNQAIAYAYYYRGLAYSKVNRKDLLMEDLNRFLTLAPKAPEAEAAKRIVASARR